MISKLMTWAPNPTWASNPLTKKEQMRLRVIQDKESRGADLTATEIADAKRILFKRAQERKAARALENNAMPQGLSEKGKLAYRTIMSVLTKDGATDTGGGQSFYSPAEWRARGEEYGKDSELIVTYDGGALGPYFSIDQDYTYQNTDKMEKALRRVGLYSEEATGWYSAIYPRD